MNESQVPARPGQRRWLLAVGGVLILCALVFWRPLQQQTLAYFLLHSEGPSPEVLSEAVQRAGQPVSLLTRLWRSQRIPHREFVLDYLSSLALTNPEILRDMEPVVLEATRDADIQVRESAFTALTRMKHPELRRLALQQLADLDPAVRLLGLQALRSIAASNDVSVGMRLLSDPEPRVVVAAALVLRQATGQDFGIKSVHASPQFTFYETNPPPAPDLRAISQGVQRWRDWWNLHQAEYPARDLTPPQQPDAVALATSDFSLSDSAGKRIHLSEYRGRVTLLAFWSLDAPANLDMLALKKLQQSNPDRLAILGICIPAIPSCCADEHEHGHGQTEHQHHHHHAESPASPSGSGPMRELVQATVRPLQINYPMLVDPKGKIALRFNVREGLAYVLIDAQGKIRRRFVGLRTEGALNALIQEVTDSGADTKRLSTGVKPGLTTENRNTETYGSNIQQHH